MHSRPVLQSPGWVAGPQSRARDKAPRPISLVPISPDSGGKVPSADLPGPPHSRSPSEHWVSVPVHLLRGGDVFGGPREDGITGTYGGHSASSGNHLRRRRHAVL